MSFSMTSIGTSNNNTQLVCQTPSYCTWHVLTPWNITNCLERKPKCQADVLFCRPRDEAIVLLGSFPAPDHRVVLPCSSELTAVR